MTGPKVLYVGGTGRTGSTVLAQLLGCLPGWFNAGELTFLWRFGLVEGGRCSCGERLPDCEVWRPILEAAGVPDEVDPERMVELRQQFRAVHLPLLASRRARSRRLDRLGDYPRDLDRLYRSIADVTGCRVVIDTSKEPLYGFILRERTSVDLRFLQLVRDPRAVLYSWRRDKPEVGLDGTPSMERRGPVVAAAYYVVSNVAAELTWRRLPDRHRFLRYEDFSADPAAVLAGICELVDESVDADALPPLPRFDPRPHHMAWGNPNRFRDEVVEIRSDESWRGSMGSLDRRLMAAFTWPVARRFGYGARRRGKSVRLAGTVARRRIPPHDPEVR